MKLQRTDARGEAIGRRAADAAAQRIVRRANLPADIVVSLAGSDVTITGKRLRRRMITNPTLRNFAHE